jgi:large subunit ribosomal protein L22
MMQTKAVYKYARVAPRKARRVVDLIRGKQAGEAMISLKFMPYRAARLIEKTVRSAMANAEQKAESIDVEQLRIEKIVVDEGPTMKRMRPRAMGRANIIKKRTSHITVHLTGEED